MQLGNYYVARSAKAFMILATTWKLTPVIFSPRQRNISEALGMYGDILEGKLVKNGVDTRIARSELKGNAAMIGSARMLDEDYFEKIKLLLAKM